MAEKLIFPKYKRSIVNLMSSIMKHYQVYSDYESIEEVDFLLSKAYKHVLLFVFDGMGEKALQAHLDKDDFLRQHMISPMESVFPPTTTAAMTSYYSGLTPAEHGWLGWSLPFRDYGAMVDIFPNTSSYTGMPMKTKRIAYREMPYESVYQSIHHSLGDRLDIHTIMPEDIYFPSKGNRHHPVRDLKHIRKVIQKITGGEKASFTAAYWPEPDSSMHTYGPYDEEIKDQLLLINGFIEELSRTLSDTLIIVSADHGQLTVEKEIQVHLDDEIRKMLVIPPALESRCASFFVKSQYLKKFPDVFEKRYGKDFRLYSHEEVKKRQLFGKGLYHSSFDDSIGDFIAVGIENAVLHFKTVGGKEPHHFKGHHAGMSDEEMLIPLIIIET